MAEPRAIDATLSRAPTLAKPEVGVLWTLAGIIALAVALRFFHLTEDSFWFDEGVSIRIGRLDLLELGRASAKDTHPPLYYLLLHVWMGIFGDSELAIRSLAAVIGVLIVPVVFLLGRALAGVGVGLAAALFCAVSPLQIEFSQEARNYSLLCLLAGLSFLALLAVIDRPSRRASIAYVVLTAGLLYTHVWALFVLLAQAAFLLCLVFRTTDGAPARRRELWRYAKLQGLALLLFSPWWYVVAKHTKDEVEGQGQIGWISRPSQSSLADTLLAYAGSRTGLVITAVIAALAVAVVRKRLLTRSTGLLVAWLAIPILVPFVLSFGPQAFYQIKYTIASSLAYFLLVAVLCLVFSQRVVRLAAVVAVTIPLVAGTVDYFRTNQKEDWRDAAAFVERNALPGDLVVFDVPYLQENAWNYYFHRSDVIERPARDGLMVGSPETPATRVWMVVGRPEDPVSVIPPELERSYRVAERPDLNFVDVTLYERREAG